MERRRLEKINELIHRFIGDLLRRELDVEALVTVYGVNTSANGQDATVSITVYPFEKSEEILKEVQKNIYEIQQKLNRGLRIRPVPKITFKIDESEEKGSKILHTIDKL
ncbi:MAG: ribosome-binding factor A [Patescibacteria group bacterium]